MKFYTSYYGNYRNIPKDYVCIGISRYCPDWMRDPKFTNFSFTEDNLLAPEKDLLDDIKSGRETEEGYKRRYVEHLLGNFGNGKMYPTFESFIKSLEENYEFRYKAIVFMCYERPGEFCHRNIVRNLMNRIFHIPCEEIEVEMKDEPKKQISLF